MAKAKSLTYDELIEYARKHYNKGGDSVYECWDENTYNYYVKEFGPITKTGALKMFKLNYVHDREMRATAW